MNHNLHARTDILFYDATNAATSVTFKPYQKQRHTTEVIDVDAQTPVLERIFAKLEEQTASFQRVQTAVEKIGDIDAKVETLEQEQKSTNAALLEQKDRPI